MVSRFVSNPIYRCIQPLKKNQLGFILGSRSASPSLTSNSGTRTQRSWTFWAPSHAPYRASTQPAASVRRRRRCQFPCRCLTQTTTTALAASVIRLHFSLHLDHTLDDIITLQDVHSELASVVGNFKFSEQLQTQAQQLTDLKHARCYTYWRFRARSCW